MDYAAFLNTKKRVFGGIGIDADHLPEQLYPWQTAIVKWALRKGRAAIFADCGLGKTFMQLAWAHALGKRTLFLAPLCVAEQTIAEGAKIGIVLRYAHHQQESDQHPGLLTITNYERLDGFDPSRFEAVVLDESSILKAFDGKTRTRLIEMFAGTRYRLCCTATPSPNDIAELANHAEFLGLMTRAEFLATWFVHDDTGWRMKRYAVSSFYRWLASWAIAIRRPSDIGYSDEGFILPPLQIHEHIVETETTGGALFPEMGLKGIGGRLAARRDSLQDRIIAAANIIDEWGVSWLAWCGLNDESQALTRELPNAIEVCGSDTHAEKVGAIEAFCANRTRVLVSKVKILGFGLNFQHCSKMVFVGLGDSYEQYYQAIRRCWRFGQQRPVDVHIIVGDAERAIVENVRRKETHADAMARDLLEHMQEFEREEVTA